MAEAALAAQRRVAASAQLLSREGRNRMVSVSRHVQVGQKVVVHELEHGCQLNVVNGEQPGLQVVEIGSDFRVLDDLAAEVKTRIPTYLIKTVTAPSETP